MKTIQSLLLNIFLLSAFMLPAQSNAKWMPFKKVIDVKALVNEAFGPELKKRDSITAEIFGEASELENYGILELRNLLDTSQTAGNIKVLSKANCELLDGQISISNAIGFAMAIGHHVILNLKDHTYQAQLFYYTDNTKQHKLRSEDDFMEDIQVDFSQVILELAPNSSFKLDGLIKGRLVGTTVPYYEKNDLKPGGKPTQYQVRSIFECRLEEGMELMDEENSEGMEEGELWPAKKKKKDKQ